MYGACVYRLRQRQLRVAARRPTTTTARDIEDDVGKDKGPDLPEVHPWKLSGCARLVAVEARRIQWRREREKEEAKMAMFASDDDEGDGDGEEWRTASRNRSARSGRSEAGVRKLVPAADAPLRTAEAWDISILHEAFEEVDTGATGYVSTPVRASRLSGGLSRCVLV